MIWLNVFTLENRTADFALIASQQPLENNAQYKIIKNIAAANGCVVGLSSSVCSHCQKACIWIGQALIYPAKSNAPGPQHAMPEAVKAIYLEAAKVVAQSPRAACALLRLAVETLCAELEAIGDTLDKKIGHLHARGLSSDVIDMLDVVRVVGNGMVHPGKIDIDDDEEAATVLFNLLNLITERLIDEPIRIQAARAFIPQRLEEARQKRNEAAKQKS
jgi:hypothetical protein